MSEPEPIPEEPENIPGKPIGKTLGAIVLVIVCSAVVVWALAAFQLSGGGRSDVRSIQILPPTQPFSETLQTEDMRRVEHADLDRWLWADRAKGVVRLPVNVAFDRYLEQRGEP